MFKLWLDLFGSMGILEVKYSGGSTDMNENCTFIEHHLAPDQKLDIAEIRRVAPDSIEVLRVKSDAIPSPLPDLVLVKANTAIAFKATEVEPNLYDNDLALLRQEFRVLEWMIW